MNVSVIGTGYVGLVSGVCLSEKGHTVICVDIDHNKVEKINRGIPPIFEASLETLLKQNLGKAFSATTNLPRAVRDTDLTMIAVGTPFDGKTIDLTAIRAATREVGKALREKSDYHVLVVKSTVVPGTTDSVVGPLLEESSGKKVGVDLGLGMNPEFLTEGQAVADFMRPDRFILGGCDDRTRETLAQLYEPFTDVPILHTNNKTAEMIKYASNALLATQISFANEMANLCSALGGVDVVDVMRGVHLSYYLRPVVTDGLRVQAPISSFLEAGCGFGGSCLPKDVNALIAHGEARGTPMPLLRAVLETNKDRPKQVLALLKRHFSSLKHVRVSILGLSFKPDTDDMRESPAIPIIQCLLAEGACLKAFDPAANAVARKVFSPDRLLVCETLEEAVTSVDAVVLVTRWEEFHVLPDLLPKLNPGALFVDGRRMLDKRAFPRYEGSGL